MSRNTKETTLISRLNKKKITICCIVLCIYICVCITPFIIFGFGHGALERAYYVSQILSGFFVISGVAVALIQYLSNNEELETERKRQSVVKAAELADEYCSEIIPYSDRLASLYSEGKLNKLLSKIKQEELIMFNREEMKDKFGEEIFDTWIIDMTERYAQMHNLNIHNYEDYKVALDEVAELLVGFSNRLESMCIKLNTGVADEGTVYQSLHANFITSVQMLYFPLSYRNTSESERVYSNVRDMYKTWNRMSQEMQKKEKDNTTKFHKEQQKKKEEFGEQFIRREKIKKK